MKRLNICYQKPALKNLPSLRSLVEICFQASDFFGFSLYALAFTSQRHLYAFTSLISNSSSWSSWFSRLCCCCTIPDVEAPGACGLSSMFKSSCLSVKSPMFKLSDWTTSSRSESRFEFHCHTCRKLSRAAACPVNVILNLLPLSMRQFDHTVHAAKCRVARSKNWPKPNLVCQKSKLSQI